MHWKLFIGILQAPLLSLLTLYLSEGVLLALIILIISRVLTPPPPPLSPPPLSASGLFVLIGWKRCSCKSKCKFRSSKWRAAQKSPPRCDIRELFVIHRMSDLSQRRRLRLLYCFRTRPALYKRRRPCIQWVTNLSDGHSPDGNNDRKSSSWGTDSRQSMPYNSRPAEQSRSEHHYTGNAKDVFPLNKRRAPRLEKSCFYFLFTFFLLSSVSSPSLLYWVPHFDRIGV